MIGKRCIRVLAKMGRRFIEKQPKKMDMMCSKVMLEMGRRFIEMPGMELARMGRRFIGNQLENMVMKGRQFIRGAKVLRKMDKRSSETLRCCAIRWLG